jgi:hypothetical protein
MMSATATRSESRPRWRRAILAGIAASGLGLAAMAWFVLSESPSVPDPGPPDAGSVAEARALAETMRDFVVVEAAEGRLRFDEGEVGSALASARRVLPGLLGRFSIDGDVAVADLSVGGPLLPAGRWINLSVALAASEDGLDVVAAKAGRVPLPAFLVLPAARFALDRYLGDGLASEALDAVSAVEIGGSEMSVSFAFPDGEDRVSFFRRLRSRLHVIAGGDAAERIYTHLWHIHEAGLDPAEGLVPYLRLVVEDAERLSDGDDRSELGSALFALALYCGEDRLGEAAGVRPSGRYVHDNACDAVELGGRHDLRKHFTVSAGLYAMRSDAAVLGVGEIKELLDSGGGGSGFSLDDMAANAAGLRFAAEFMEAPASDWAGMLDLVRTGDDILPPLDGLDSGMTAEEFESRYGDIDSPAYKAAIAEIGRRIDALPLYARNRLN